MNLFHISYLNFKKSKKDYGVYLFTLILSIIVFYIFNAIGDKSMMNILITSQKFAPYLDIFTLFLNIFSLFVMVLFAQLIVYASKFLFKRRKKEFALYQLLGMSKQQMTLMLFYETLILGAISLVIGLTLAIGLSQLVNSIVVSALLHQSMTFQFAISTSTIIKTILYFIGMYALVFIFNGISISYSKIISLKQSKAKTENLDHYFKINIALFILGILVLSQAFYMVVTPSMLAYGLQIVVFAVILGIIGTFCLVKGLSRVIYGLAKTNKRHYFKGINNYTIKSIAQKFNQHAMMISVVTISLFITMCIFGVSMSFKTSYSATMENLMSVDASLTYYIDETNPTISLDESFNQYNTSHNINLDSYQTSLTFNTYESPFTLATLLKADKATVLSQYPNMYLDRTLNMISYSDYVNLANLANYPVSVNNENGYFFLSNAQDSILPPIFDLIINNNSTLQLNDQTLSLSQSQIVKTPPNIVNNPSELIIVVDDAALLNYPIYKQTLLVNYSPSGDINALDDTILNFATQIQGVLDLKSIQNESSAFIVTLMVFIGVYLGCVFAIVCGTMLSLNMLAETMDDAQNIETLTKLGVSKQLIYRNYWKNLTWVFLIPLLLASIDSIFGITFSQFLFSNVISTNLFSILGIALFILIVYGGYYLVSGLSCQSIIKQIID